MHEHAPHHHEHAQSPHEHEPASHHHDDIHEHLSHPECGHHDHSHCRADCGCHHHEASDHADELFAHHEHGHDHDTSCQCDSCEAADHKADELFDHHDHSHEHAHGEAGHICSSDCQHTHTAASEQADELFHDTSATHEAAPSTGKAPAAIVDTSNVQIETPAPSTTSKPSAETIIKEAPVVAKATPTKAASTPKKLDTPPSLHKPSKSATPGTPPVLLKQSTPRPIVPIADKPPARTEAAPLPAVTAKKAAPETAISPQMLAQPLEVPSPIRMPEVSTVPTEAPKPPEATPTPVIPAKTPVTEQILPPPTAESADIPIELPPAPVKSPDIAPAVVVPAEPEVVLVSDDIDSSSPSELADEPKLSIAPTEIDSLPHTETLSSDDIIDTFVLPTKSDPITDPSSNIESFDEPFVLPATEATPSSIETPLSDDSTPEVELLTEESSVVADEMSRFSELYGYDDRLVSELTTLEALPIEQPVESTSELSPPQTERLLTTEDKYYTVHPLASTEQAILAKEAVDTIAIRSPEVEHILIHLHAVSRHGGNYPAMPQLVHLLAAKLGISEEQTRQLLQLTPDYRLTATTSAAIARLLQGNILVRTTQPHTKISWLIRLKHYARHQCHLIWTRINRTLPLADLAKL